MPTKETSYNKLFKIFCNEFKEFNEAIAQYIVSIGIRGNIVLEQLFDWLCENQDQIYKNKLKDEINALSVLRNYIEKNCDSDKKESIPKTFDEYNNNFLNKMRGLIAGKTFGL
jgi:hypothetical protein